MLFNPQGHNSECGQLDINRNGELNTTNDKISLVEVFVLKFSQQNDNYIHSLSETIEVF